MPSPAPTNPNTSGTHPWLNRKRASGSSAPSAARRGRGVNAAHRPQRTNSAPRGFRQLPREVRARIMGGGQLVHLPQRDDPLDVDELILHVQKINGTDETHLAHDLRARLYNAADFHQDASPVDRYQKEEYSYSEIENF